jgi:hypothetical protein
MAMGLPDPHRLCKDEGPTTCGYTGRCNGQGGCTRYAPGTPCKPQSCAGGSMVPAATCDGRGTCVDSAAIACEPYQCAGTACIPTCQSDTECVAPATCSAGSCGSRGLGQACKNPNDCKSGFCADGVCCTETCEGKCRFCALPTALGRCVNVPADTPDPRAAAGVTDPSLVCVVQPAGSCGSNGLCNGDGGCALYGSETVCKPESCDAASNSYTGVFTCSGDGRCEPPASGNCAPFTCKGARCGTSCTANTDCVPPASCQMGSCGKKAMGQMCGTGAECASGQCAQGVCCNMACSGSCLSCALPGTVGLCVPVPSGSVDPAGVCRDQGAMSCGTDGSCNGAGGCRRYAAGTLCRAASCSAGQATAASTCDGVGACQAGAARACAPYVCNAAGTDCYNSCTDLTQCVAGTPCIQNRCGKKSLGAPCTSPSECSSNFCIDGVCCNAGCAAACQTCALPGALGTCSPIPAGMSDPDGSCGPTCTTGGTAVQGRICDGTGICGPSGTPAACGAYLCRNGACLTVCAVDGDCAPGNVCAARVCVPSSKKPNGATCVGGTECQSGNCVNGTCCASVSCASCQSCGNAMGTCQAVAAGTACGPGACSADGNSTITPACNAASQCGPGMPVSCGSYKCNNGTCRTSCASDAECSPGNRCRGAKCH